MLCWFHPVVFYMVCFHFYSPQSIFQFLSLCILLWPVDYIRVYCLISAYLWILQISFCYWLWSENILHMISILLNLLRFVLCPNVWSIYVPCAPEKNVYPAVVGWSVLQIFNRPNWYIILFVSFISLLIYCLIVVSIIESSILRSLTVIVESCISHISPSNSVNVCFLYFWSLLFRCVSVYLLRSLDGWPFLSWLHILCLCKHFLS